VGNIAGLFAVGPHTDETYYWVWSRYLEWGYFDHPPLVAWMIRLSSDIFGTNIFSLRFPAALSWVVTVLVVYRIGHRLMPENPLAGWLSALTVGSIPIFQVGFHIVGPDSPLMIFTSLAYLFAFNALEERTRKNWLYAGVVLGFALLGKYTAVLLPAIVFLSVVSGRQARHQLRHWAPWVGLVLAFCLFLPVIYWNRQHDWISFAYQWGHGTESKSGFSIFKLLDYISQQISAVMPWTWLAMIYASIRFPRLVDRQRGDSWLLIEYGFWFPLVFFGITGSFSTAMHNWPVIAYVPGSILLGTFLARLFSPDESAPPRLTERKARLFVVSAVLFAALLVDLARFPQWAKYLPDPKRLGGSSVVAVWGWDGLASEIRNVQKTEKLPSSCPMLFIKKYNNASLGYFHVAGEMAFAFKNPDRILLERTPHQKQYNLWPNTRWENRNDICMVIAGPAKSSDYPNTLFQDHLGELKLAAKHTITLPDTTSSYYGIYTRTSQQK